MIEACIIYRKYFRLVMRLASSVLSVSVSMRNELADDAVGMVFDHCAIACHVH